MKASAVAAVAALSAMVEAADSEPKPCTAQMCGQRFDLNPLSSSSDYVFSSHSGRNFTLNVCRSVVSEPWNLRVDRPGDVGGFVRGDHGDISIGQANSTVHFRNGDPIIYMMGGSSCPQSESMKTSTAIHFICDTSIDVGTPSLVAQLPPEDDGACAFFIEWKTKYGCPVPDRYAYWKTAVMVIVILLALTLTITALLFMHKIIKRRRNSFSSSNAPVVANGYTAGGFAGGVAVGGGPRSWPSAIAERARDVKRLLTGQDPWGHPNGYHPNSEATRRPRTTSRGSVNGGRGWFSVFKAPWSRSSRYGRNNFSRLPQSAEEEAMMGGGPFSVEDEDEEDAHEVNGVDAGVGAEESAAWSSDAPRPRGVDGAGVIRL